MGASVCSAPFTHSVTCEIKGKHLFFLELLGMSFFCSFTPYTNTSWTVNLTQGLCGAGVMVVPAPLPPIMNSTFCPPDTRCFSDMAQAAGGPWGNAQEPPLAQPTAHLMSSTAPHTGPGSSSSRALIRTFPDRRAVLHILRQLMVPAPQEALYPPLPSHRFGIGLRPSCSSPWL